MSRLGESCKYGNCDHLKEAGELAFALICILRYCSKLNDIGWLIIYWRIIKLIYSDKYRYFPLMDCLWIMSDITVVR